MGSAVFFEGFLLFAWACRAGAPVSAWTVCGMCPYGYTGGQTSHFQTFHFRPQKTVQMLPLIFVFHIRSWCMRFFFSSGGIQKVFAFTRISFVIFFFSFYFEVVIHDFLSFLSALQRFVVDNSIFQIWVQKAKAVTPKKSWYWKEAESCTMRSTYTSILLHFIEQMEHHRQSWWFG